MATSTSTGAVTVTLSNTDTYIGLVVVGVLAAILGFVTHTIPSWVGYTGVATTLIVFFGYLADEFVVQSWAEYLVITVVAAVIGVVGSLTGVENVTLATVLAWVVAFLAAVYHSLSERGGSYFTAQQETWAIGITGAALSFFTWWLGDPTATTAMIITTLVATVGQFFRVTAKGSGAPSVAAPTAPTPVTM